ncbi:DoxX family protein [Spirillospora sp. CA-255316]
MTGSIEAADSSAAAHAGIAAARVGVGLMWIQNSGWKTPPDFGEDRDEGLYESTRLAVEHEVLAPWAWLVEHVVLPNFTFFGWATLLVEASLGAFLLVGLATRFWALVGAGQSVLITLSVLNAPGEWHWSRFLMVLVHVLLFATAAGRHYGLDAVWRPLWQRSPGRVSRWLLRAS